jgi:branched-chain amino acid transport system substrate-binding protein
MKRRSSLSTAAVTVSAAVAFYAGLMGTSRATETVPVGHLATLSGPTSPVAKVYAQGIIDAFDFMNANGGIDNKQIDLDTRDYGYDAHRAVEIYQSWLKERKPVAIQGWGTPDTEALVGRVTEDEIVFMSGSSSGHLTDPTGRSPWTDTPAPYNFFYGPSYSDACRGVIQWAAEDWKKTGGAARSTFLEDLYRAKFVYMGDNHPYPNSPKAACIEYARELGFDVLPPIRYSLSPGDFSAQCLSLKQSGANYAFLGNTAESNVQLLKACSDLGVSTQFMTNIYGWDEEASRAAGNAGNGLVWVVSASPWGENVPGMETVRAVSRMSDETGKEVRPAHYIRGVCSAFFMRDAMAAAAAAGAIDGPGIKKGFEAMRDHVPAELEGVCLPSTWTAEDHRGTSTVTVYRSTYNYGNVAVERLFTTRIPLRPDWLGW